MKIARKRSEAHTDVNNNIQNRTGAETISRNNVASSIKESGVVGAETVVDVDASLTVNASNVIDYVGKVVNLKNGAALTLAAALEDFACSVKATGSNGSLVLPDTTSIPIVTTNGRYFVDNDGSDNYSVKWIGQSGGGGISTQPPQHITANQSITSANAETYNGAVLQCNNTSAITISINSNVPANFHVAINPITATANVHVTGAGVMSVENGGNIVKELTYLFRKGNVLYYRPETAVESNQPPSFGNVSLQGSGIENTIHIIQATGYTDFENDPQDSGATEYQWRRSSSASATAETANVISGQTGATYSPPLSDVYVWGGARAHAQTGTLVGNWQFTPRLTMRQAGTGIASIIGAKHVETWKAADYNTSTKTLTGSNGGSFSAFSGAPVKSGNEISFDGEDDGLERALPSAVSTFRFVELIRVGALWPDANYCYSGLVRGGSGEDYAAFAAWDNNQPRCYTRNPVYNNRVGDGLTNPTGYWMRLFEMVPGVGLTVTFASMANANYAPIPSVNRTELPTNLTHWDIGFERRVGPDVFSPGAHIEWTQINASLTTTELGDIFTYYKSLIA